MKAANAPRPRAKERYRCVQGKGTSYIQKPSELGKAPRPWHGEQPRAGGRHDWPRRAALGGRAPPIRRKGSGGRGFAPTMFGRRPNATRAPRTGSKGAGRALTSAPRRGLCPRLPRGTLVPRACQQGAARSPEAPRPHLARSVAEAGQAQRARPAWGRLQGPGRAWR